MCALLGLLGRPPMRAPHPRMCPSDSSGMRRKLVRVELELDAQAAQLHELHEELSWAEEALTSTTAMLETTMSTLESTQATLHSRDAALAALSTELEEVRAKADALDRLRRIQQLHASRKSMRGHVQAFKDNVQGTVTDIHRGLAVPSGQHTTSPAA